MDATRPRATPAQKRGVDEDNRLSHAIVHVRNLVVQENKKSRAASRQSGFMEVDEESLGGCQLVVVVHVHVVELLRETTDCADRGLVAVY